MLALLIAEASDQPVWWLVGATFTVAAVGVGALLSVWDARKTRHTQLLIELSTRWEDEAAIESSVRFRSYGGAEEAIALIERLYAPGVTTREPADIENWQKISIYPDLIEVIGVFVERRMIPRRLVYDMWGGNIYEAWAEYEPTVRKLRELTQKDPLWLGQADKLFEHFERLANWMEFYLWAERNGLPATRWGWYWLYLSNVPAAWWRRLWIYE